MRRLLNMLFLFGLAIAMGGCAMCQSPDDEAYSAYGGVVQRHDMYHGRVGSILGPAGIAGPVDGIVSETLDVDRSYGEPTPAEEVEPAEGMPEATPEESEAEPEESPPEPMSDGEDTPMTPEAPEVFFE